MPKALCQSYNVNPANQPKLGVQMNSLTLHGALMVPKCLLCKSRPKGILPLTTFHKVKRLFLGTPFIFWGKSNLTDLRVHYRWTTGHCKRTLVATSLLPLCFCGRTVTGNLESSPPLGEEKRDEPREICSGAVYSQQFCF